MTLSQILKCNLKKFQGLFFKASSMNFGFARSQLRRFYYCLFQKGAAACRGGNSKRDAGHKVTKICTEPSDKNLFGVVTWDGKVTKNIIGFLLSHGCYKQNIVFGLIVQSPMSARKWKLRSIMLVNCVINWRINTSQHWLLSMQIETHINSFLARFSKNELVWLTLSSVRPVEHKYTV